MFLTGNKGYRCKDKIQMSLWRITFINLVFLYVCVCVPPGLYQTLVLKSCLIFQKSTLLLLNFYCKFLLVLFHCLNVYFDVVQVYVHSQNLQSINIQINYPYTAISNLCYSDLQDNMHIERIPSNAFLGLTSATITEL